MMMELVVLEKNEVVSFPAGRIRTVLESSPTKEFRLAGWLLQLCNCNDSLFSASKS